MKKFTNIVCIALLVVCASVTFVACGKKYTPNLMQSYSANGFEVKTTADFKLEEEAEGLKLSSKGDGTVNFAEATITMQYDCGNDYYDFENTTLEQYMADIATIEGLTLKNPSSLNIKEKLADSTQKVKMTMYVVSLDSFYKILICGKAQSSFVYIEISTKIQSKYYSDNIKKYKAIVESVVFTQPETDEVTIDESVESLITNPVYTYLAYHKLSICSSNDYSNLQVDSDESNYHLETIADFEETGWSSTVYCYETQTSNECTTLDNFGAIHLISFSGDMLAFYTKTTSVTETQTQVEALETEEADEEEPVPTEATKTYNAQYNFYFINADGELHTSYATFSVSCSEELAAKGFLEYFESQAFSWLQSTSITEDDHYLDVVDLY
jgi:hypothetical protein